MKPFITATLLVLALSGCVESRDRAYAKCEYDNMNRIGHFGWAIHFRTCMEAGGYQVTPKCGRLFDASMQARWLPCWVPLGLFDRVVFQADAKLRRRVEMQ